MIRNITGLIVFGLLIFSIPGPITANQIGQSGPLRITINSDYFRCNELALLTVWAPDAHFFQGDKTEVRKLIDATRAKLTSRCAILKRIEVFGHDGSLPVYRGRAEADANWALEDVIVNRSGGKGPFINKDEELILYQDKNLTIKGPPLNYALNWCESGFGTHKNSPLNVRAFYKVGHLERHSLFQPDYEEFVERNIIPPILDYCGRMASRMTLMMMDTEKEGQFWDTLAFSVEDGKAVGVAYSPPPAWKTESLDPDMLDAHVKKMAVAMNDQKHMQGLPKATGPTTPVKSGALRRYLNMSSHVDVMHCSRDMNLYIQTRQAGVYEGDRKHLQTLVDAERADQLRNCRQVERFVIHGAVKGNWYFRGTSTRADNWAIKGQIIQNDDKYLQPYMFPDKPDDIYKLGLMYLSGERLAVNQSLAASKLREAAERGHAEAQFLLGTLYEKGVGVEKHQHHARKWIEKAAAQGHQKARRHLRLRDEDAKMAERKKIEAEKAARRKGIVYKSNRFWQEFTNFEAPRKVFEGEFAGLHANMHFKRYYLEFVAVYSDYCSAYLPPRDQCVPKTWISYDVTLDRAGLETSRREDGRTTIYIDPRFAKAFERYLRDVENYDKVAAAKAAMNMMKNLGKQNISDTINDALHELNVLEMRKFFGKVGCDSATMKQMKGNMLQAATSGQSLQAAGAVIDNAQAESDPVELSVRQKTFEEACHEYHNRRNPGNYDRWCGCLDREAKKVMTAAELAHFADDFGSYYRDIDNKQDGPNDPRWRLQGPLNKCRR